ncbi:MAG TPA: isoprenylcysteine carboxylmethyltransferase family protein [Methyloceanibacter sp.]|jgi:protein-S-isoprenylcysteine O-methyltransferase Ste14|nr:isoprenylcysteine carboxylmethyltransferase family protein [Methyloceanibacter sp.]
MAAPGSDYADVAIKPPFLFLGALALGCLLSLVLPIGPGLASPNGLGFTVGAIFVAIGLALAILSVRRFRIAGTSVVPGEPSTALVVEGPYQFTRNPIYIGFVLIYFGLAVILTSLWVLLLLIPVLIVLQRGVVEREEVYLERQFGDAYRKYQARVPRWL